ncbi:MAG: hypothetical protein IPK32_02355 [Verrucomicrobiaceae bacterium]|nr:hypothetical protein [Verrucomicrobiaceae bacterium]
MFFSLSVFVGMAATLSFGQPAWLGALLGVGYWGVLLTLDHVLNRSTLREFSNATIGLAIGLLCAWLVTRVDIFELDYIKSQEYSVATRSIFGFCIYGVLSYLGITFALRSDRENFAFLIPFVRFRREASEGEPVVLDVGTSYDSRVPRLFETGFLNGTAVVPRFVLDELQRMADSTDAALAARGKRGLEQMEKLRGIKDMRVTIHEDAGDAKMSADARLVALTREVNARLLTHDESLARVARLRGITVLSLPELASALVVETAAGDEFSITLTKPGKEKHQAIGYLENGTMIVVNHSAQLIGQTVAVIVCGAHMTSAGKLVFAELKQA